MSGLLWESAAWSFRYESLSLTLLASSVGEYTWYGGARGIYKKDIFLAKNQPTVRKTNFCAQAKVIICFFCNVSNKNPWQNKLFNAKLWNGEGKIQSEDFLHDLWQRDHFKLFGSKHSAAAALLAGQVLWRGSEVRQEKRLATSWGRHCSWDWERAKGREPELLTQRSFYLSVSAEILYFYF